MQTPIQFVPALLLVSCTSLAPAGELVEDAATRFHRIGLLADFTGENGGGAPIDVSSRVERLGNPLAKRYPDGSQFQDARQISALQVFDGKLYVGHGDWGLNSGPTDIWYYDLHKKELDRKSTRLNSSHIQKSRMPSSA